MQVDIVTNKLRDNNFRATYNKTIKTLFKEDCKKEIDFVKTTKFVKKSLVK